MYTFLVVYTKNMYFYFILILSIYKQVGGRGISGEGGGGSSEQHQEMNKHLNKRSI